LLTLNFFKSFSLNSSDLLKIYISFQLSYNFVRSSLVTKFSTTSLSPSYKLSTTNIITFIRLRYSLAVNLAIDCNPLEKISRSGKRGIAARRRSILSTNILPLLCCDFKISRVKVQNDLCPNLFQSRYIIKQIIKEKSYTL